MYCKNCGAEYPSPDSVMCVKCGAPKGEGNLTPSLNRWEKW